MLGSADQRLLEAMEMQPLAANFHRASVSTAFGDKYFTPMFRIISTSVDGGGQEFIAAIEGVDLPWYGTQWHPEKPAGEWSLKNGRPYQAINHSPEAIRLGQHMADFLVSEAGLNSHGNGQDSIINP